MFTSIKNRTKGFTLIELLVVIAIIGILSSVVLASLGTARQKARDATRISDMKNVQLALSLYFDTAQGYPVNDGTANNHLMTTATTLSAAIVGPALYIPALPSDPLAGSRAANEEYVYQGLSTAGADCSTAGSVCSRVIIGAWFERSDNPILNSDSDLDVTSGVDGDGSDRCTDGAAAAGDRCYAIAE